MARVTLALLALAPLAAAPGCSDDPLTQVVVVVDSDWDGFSRIEVEVGGFEDAASTSADLEMEPLPRRFSIVHAGGPLGPISVTTRAFVASVGDEPVLVEPRTGIEFQRDRSLLLKVNLHFECIGECRDEEACLAGGRCVDAEEAAELSEWAGAPEALPVDFRVEDSDTVRVLEDDAGMTSVVPVQDGSVASGGDGDGTTDAAVDAGPDVPDAEPPDPPAVVESGFDYVTSNFDPDASPVADAERVAVSIDCPTATFDSTALSFTGWCGPEPAAVVVTQSDDSEAAVLVMDTLEVRAGGRLRLLGARPVIFAVHGGAAVHGTIDASAEGVVSGPGAGIGCSAPEPGTAGTSGGGGGGGGFATIGGSGGASESNGSVAGGAGGMIVGEPTLSPLRGGCPGAPGGDGNESMVAPAGGGGGALQISAAGRLEVNGAITAVGGGGGGSGGAILLEGAPVDVDSAAVIAAGGGGGGEGQPTSGTGAELGADGSRTSPSSAPGGSSESSGGDGGRGAAEGVDAAPGAIGPRVGVFPPVIYGGGGGGGGGLGRVRINGLNLCPPRGIYSVWPSVGCDDCGVCARSPGDNCTPVDAVARQYFVCTGNLEYAEMTSFCTDAGLLTASVRSADENAALAAVISDNTYLGGDDLGAEGVWLWASDGANFWNGAADGSSPTYANWAEGEPNNSNGEHCLFMSTAGTWVDTECNDNLDWVCEVPQPQ